MKEVRLTIKKRAFPSQGRVRLNLAHLPELGIREGDHVDLVNETTKKSVTATVIADTMVRVGHVRVSEEDLKSIGLNDDDDVLVRKTPPLQEKIKKAAADASKSLSKSAGKLDETVKKTTVDVKAGAAKTADTVKKETKKASDTVGKAATKTVKEVKKTVKKVIGPKDEL
jgi:anaerobic selenocysteine-containing dehydrogenase